MANAPRDFHLTGRQHLFEELKRDLPKTGLKAFEKKDEQNTFVVDLAANDRYNLKVLEKYANDHNIFPDEPVSLRVRHAINHIITKIQNGHPLHQFGLMESNHDVINYNPNMPDGTSRLALSLRRANPKASDTEVKRTVDKYSSGNYPPDFFKKKIPRVYKITVYSRD